MKSNLMRGSNLYSNSRHSRHDVWSRMSVRRTSFGNKTLLTSNLTLFWFNSAVRSTDRTDYSSLGKACCSYGRMCTKDLRLARRCVRSRWNLRNRRPQDISCCSSPPFQASAWSLRNHTLPHSRLHRSLKTITKWIFLSVSSSRITNPLQLSWES